MRESHLPPAHERPRRLWLLVAVLVMAGVGARYAVDRRSAGVSERVDLGGGRAQLLELGMGVCAQCRRMRPVLEQVGRELADTLDVHVVDVRRAEHEQLAERFRMITMPLIVLVDGAGRELWRHEGFIDFPELSAAVTTRLGARADSGRSALEGSAP